MLRDLQEFSYQEIADRLRLPEGTVKSRINRGRLELARQISRLAGQQRRSRKVRRAEDPNERHDVTTQRRHGRAAGQRTAADLSRSCRTSRRAATNLIGSGEKRIVIDLSAVGYVDSAAIGCLMDLYRQATAAGGVAEARRRAEARRDDADDDRRAQLPRGPRRRGVGARELRSIAMRTITTVSGSRIELDGDVLAVIETISRDLARRQELDYGFEDVDREFQHVVAQLTDEELRVYLKESLFMSFNRYENDRMLAIVRKANRATRRGPSKGAGIGAKV